MTFFDVISLLGGLGLFLYGMSMMGAGLEKLAGSKLESILRKLTSSPITGALLGLGITAIIQSSSATTVIVIGLVNAGLMKFSQAVGVVMGANIGTTVTAQILRLSEISGDNFFLNLAKPSTLAPLSILIGTILFLFLNKTAKNRNVGNILIGFGTLFTGMMLMETSVKALRDLPWFADLFSSLQNPILGVLAGLLVTAVIQSSSASIGILQALSATGIVTWGSAIPIILGQNIGTCITGVLASIGASRAAKRVAACHVWFNTIGTIICLSLVYAFKSLFGAPFWNNVIGMGEIANFHTVFNVSTTLFFLCFQGVLIKLSTWAVPEKDESAPSEFASITLDTRLYTSPALALAQARNAVREMAQLVNLMQKSAVSLMLSNDAEGVHLAQKREEITDKLDVNITNYLVGITRLELTEQEGREAANLLAFVNEFERIGDRAVNVIEQSGIIYEQGIVFSDIAKKEMNILDAAVGEVLDLAISTFVKEDFDAAVMVEPLEQTVDALCETMRERHIARLKEDQCSIEAGIIFLEVLNNYERISDHCSNVAARQLGSREKAPDAHKLRRRMHKGEEAEYAQWAAHYQEKYTLP